MITMETYLKTPFKRRWLRATFITLLLSLVMVGLGFWQLQKHALRQAYVQGVIAEVNDTPFTLTGSPADDVLADRVFHQARAEGVFDFDHQVAVQNQFYKDEVGYHLVTPFKIKGSDRAVLVDRGWIPPDGLQTPDDARKFDEPGLTTVLGRIIAPVESSQPPETPQFRWLRVDTANIGKQLPYEILPFYLALIPPETPQTAPPYRDPPKFKLDPGTHFNNALEWFLFALLTPFFYAWLVVRTDRLEQTP